MGVNSLCLFIGIGILGVSGSSVFSKVKAFSPDLPVQKISEWKFERFGKLPDGSSRPEPQNVTAPDFDDSSWETVHVPHDWAIEGPFCWGIENDVGKLPWRGIGVYRTQFTVGRTEDARKIFFDFDGVMANSTVYLNGREIGGRPYGYSAFRADGTDAFKPGEVNTLAVRVDAGKWGSRWYPGAGIYRNVNMILKDSEYHFKHWGIRSVPTVGKDGSGHLRVEAEFTKGGCDIGICGVDSQGELIRSTALVLKRESDTVFSTEIPNVRLWSPETPNQYMLYACLSEKGMVNPKDFEGFMIGFKTVELSAKDGMKLNGKPYTVKGVCMHHDLGALGAAANRAAIRRQIRILKSFGVNAVRFTHNPPSKDYLELCDEMGLLAVDEAFDTWTRRKKANDYESLFNAWSERDAADMVRRDRNHVSIFMWSIGNEVEEQYWGEKGGEIGRKLADAVRREDPLKRPVTAGVSAGPGGWNGFAEKALDILGYNYRLHEYNPWFEKPLSKKMPFHGSETASTVSSRGEYFFPVKREVAGFKNNEAFQVSSYDLLAPPWANSPDEQFEMLDRYPSAFGEFVWTGFDYLGEPTPYNADNTNVLNFAPGDPRRVKMEKELSEIGKIRVPSRSSYFGIVDLAGFPKDRMYMYIARWMPDSPTAHLLPHWNWPERVGKVTPVHLYSSGDEAELFLNGKSMGIRKRGKFEYRFRWDEVVYEPGELKAVVRKNGQLWATAVRRTTGEAVKLDAHADRSTIAFDGEDLSFITVRIADSNGETVPRTGNTITFEIEGDGEIIATDNGDAASFESFKSPSREAFNGMCLGIVRGKKGSVSPFSVKISGEGLESAKLVIKPLHGK